MDKGISRRSKQLVFELVLCGVSVLLFQLPVLATQSVTLAWSPITNSDLAGYNIYYSSIRHTYTNVITVGNVTNATIAGLMEGTTYYFAVTTLSTAGLESDFSEEICYKVPSAATTLMVLPGSAVQFSFSVSGVSGYRYVVQSSTNLIDWISVQTNTAPFTFTDTNAVRLQQCFYRTFYLPP